MTKKTPKRRIKRASISLISLVPFGSNGVASIIKGTDLLAPEHLCAVAKVSPEGYLHALVYQPDDVDDQGDTAGPEAVQQMAHEFLLNKEGTGIDVLHSCEALAPEQAHICETFIVQKGDPRFDGITKDDGSPLDPTGAWGVIVKLSDPDLREKYASGEWVGVSMYGSARVEPLTKSQKEPEVHEVDEAKVTEIFERLFKAQQKDLVGEIVKALEPQPNDQSNEPTAPVVEFEGDPNSVEDLAKHAEKVLFASLDMSKPADIAKWQAHLAKKASDAQAAEEARKQAEAKDPNAQEIAKLQKEIDRLRGKPSTDGTGEPSSDTSDEGDQTPSQLMAKAAKRAVELRKEGVIR